MGNKQGKTKGLNKVHTSNDQPESQQPSQGVTSPQPAQTLSPGVSTPLPEPQNGFDDPNISRQGVKEMITPDGSFTIRYACLTQKGYYPDALDKENQDSFYCDPSFDLAKDDDKSKSCAFFGVFDGHGSFGDKCSRFCRDTLAGQIKNHPKYSTDFLTAYKEAFVTTNQLLHEQRNKKVNAIDDTMSGTTAITIMMRGRDIYVGNVGDSRAVGAAKDENGNVVAISLSIDQTPYREDELRRVKQCGARVQTLDQMDGLKNPFDECWGKEEDDDGDPPRLWLPGERYPGTAFTRSIGDGVAETIGVYANPEIQKRSLTKDDLFLVICSDGVFEFISSQQVVDIVNQYEDPMLACRALISEAYRLWLQYEIRTDDITAIVIQVSNLKSKSQYKKVLESPEQRIRPVRKNMSRAKEVATKGNCNELTEEEENYVLPKEFNGLPEEHEIISNAVKSNFLFKNLDEKTQNGVINAMIKINAKAGDVIIKQGDDGDRFFIAYSGTYDVLVSRGNDSPPVCVHKYTTANNLFPSFGELALMYGKPRAATVKCSSDGILFGLNRTAFRSIIMKNKSDPVIKTLRSVNILESLTTSQLRKLSRCLAEVSYKEGTYILRQGEVGNEFFIIQSGEVVCSKSETPGGPEKEVMRLGPNQYFGERALLGGKDCERAANVVATTPVHCFQLGRKDFEDILGPLQDLINKDREKREKDAALKLEFEKNQQTLELDDIKLNDLLTLACVATSGVSVYKLVKHLDKEKIYTLRSMPKKFIQDHKLEVAVMRERSILYEISYKNNCVPGTLMTFQDSDCLHIIMNTCLVGNIRSLIESNILNIVSIKYLVCTLVTELGRFQEMDLLFRGIDSTSMGYNDLGKLVLLDFKYSKICNDKTYTMCGTAPYMSPQMVSGQGHDMRADIWALGVFIYELVTGETPFAKPGYTEIQIYKNITNHSGCLTLPEKVDPLITDLINKLVVLEPRMRLGCTDDGSIDDIKQHPWFKDTDWKSYENDNIGDSPLLAISNSLYQNLINGIGGIACPLIPSPDNPDNAWCEGF